MTNHSLIKLYIVDTTDMEAAGLVCLKFGRIDYLQIKISKLWGYMGSLFV